MRFIDHGNWVTYVPENHPLLEYNVLFCRRISDGIDWYEFQRSELTHLDTIKLTLLLVNKKHWQVQTTARYAHLASESISGAAHMVSSTLAERLLAK